VRLQEMAGGHDRLLALLFLLPIQVVPADRLMEELWCETRLGSAPHPPHRTTAARPLQVSLYGTPGLRPRQGVRPRSKSAERARGGSRRREGAEGETSCDSTLARARFSGMSRAFEKGGQRRVEVNDLSNRARSAAMVTRTRAPSAA
jgi:hypothetical protein